MQAGASKFSSPFARVFYWCGQVDALLAVMEARGLLSAPESRTLAEECTDACRLDTDYLETLLRRAVKVGTVEEVFAGHLPDQDSPAEDE